MTTTQQSSKTSPQVEHLRLAATRLAERADALIDRALQLHYAQADIQQRLAALESVQ